MTADQYFEIWFKNNYPFNEDQEVPQVREIHKELLKKAYLDGLYLRHIRPEVIQ